MIRLGVTGGIGSGKSYVCRIMQEHFGIPVYCSDIRARIITLSDPDVIDQLTAIDPRFYDADGELDKQRLAQYMFGNEEHLRQVNGIIHPAVRRDFREWCSCHSRHPIVALESAILYESGFDSEVDKVLFVDAPEDIRLLRTTQRDGSTPSQVRLRMAHQQTHEARQRADFVILNDGNTDIVAELRKHLNINI